MTTTPQVPDHIIAFPPEPPRRRRTGTVLAIVGAFVVVVVIGLVALGVYVSGALQHETTSATVPGVRELVVDVDEGTVVLEAATGSAVEVSATRSWTQDFQPAVARDVVDGVLTLTSDCPSFNLGCEVELRVAVPAGTAVRVRTVDGSVEAVGIDAPRFSASTVSGSVTAAFTGSPADVRVRTVAGAAVVEVPGGGAYRVSTDSVAGSVDVGVPTDPEATGKIDIGTVTGSIRISSR